MGWTPPHLNGIDVPDWKRHRPVNREKESTMKLIRVGVDLAKSVFQVHGVDRSEKAVWRRRLSRESWIRVLLETIEPGCEIGEVAPMTIQEFVSRQTADRARYGAFIKEAGIKVD
jgi:hypothetical protein